MAAVSADVFLWLLYRPFFLFRSGGIAFLCISRRVAAVLADVFLCISRRVAAVSASTGFVYRFDGLRILRVRGSEIMPRSLFIVCSQPTPGRQTSRRELSHYSQLPYYLREFADSEHARILGKGRLFVPIICLLIYLLTYLFNSLLVFCFLFIYLVT